MKQTEEEEEEEEEARARAIKIYCRRKFGGGRFQETRNKIRRGAGTEGEF